MFKQKVILFSTLFFVCFNSKSFSQIVASPTAGCVPQNISFTGPAGTGILWQFGDGGTSNQQNPGHIYTTAGNYVVTYTSSAGTFTTPVKISPTPTANFTYQLPASHCAPMTVTFVNTSTSGTTITQSQWNFGNGVPSSSFSPIYAYPGSGQFNVNLTITDANGCSGTVQAGPINVSTPPNIIISTNPSPPSGCTAPFTCTFNGSSSTSGSPLGGALSYNWSFAGGSPASSGNANQGVTYGAVGNYVAIFTVTDNNQCSASQSIPVSVSQPTLSTTVPTVVCPGKTFSISFSTNQAAANWNMVNGFTVVPTVGAPTTFTYMYPFPGTFVVQASVGNPPCSVTQTRQIVVELVTASISVANAFSTCANPLVATYSNASSPNAVTYSWSSTGCAPSPYTYTSNLANPTFSFVQGSINPYTIYQLCVPMVNLLVTSAAGCTAQTSISTYSLQRPTAWFLKNKKEGCAPLAVTLRDSSFAYPTPTVITSYTWNNGASPPTIITGVAPPINPVTFTYNTPGTYTPFLTIQTAQGCTDVSFIDTVKVVSTPSLSFSFSPTIVCATTPVTITNTSPSFTSVNHWHFQSDLGHFSSCVSDPNPQWQFTNIGVHNFTMQAWANSCPGNTTAAQSLTVQGPIVRSLYRTSCTNRYTVFFKSQVQDAANGNINFGDGNSSAFAGSLGTVITHTINHTYTATGNYTVNVTASNGSGTCSPSTYTMLVMVRDVQANIAMSNTSSCVTSNLTFSANPSVDQLVTCSMGYSWYFDNLPPTVSVTPVTSLSFATAGTHTVTLQLKDVNDCMSTTTRTFHISDVFPAFTASPNPLCLSSGTVQFTNLTPPNPDPIATYTWNFGDGSPASTATNPTHTYSPPINPPGAIFNVMLSATNTLGCVASTIIPVQVNNPSAQLTANPGQFICVGQTVVIGAPSGYQTYSLSFGDGSPNYVGGNNNSIHSYTAPGGYTAAIQVIDMAGCKNNGILTFSVQSYPTASFIITSAGSQSSNVVCLGGNTTYSSVSTSTPTYPLTYAWDISNGQTIQPLQAVVATYTSVGVYPVTLTVTTPNGCSSIYTNTVGVYGANANISANKTNFCLGETITFSINNPTGVFAYEWDFGEGTTTSTIMAGPPPLPPIANTYTYYPTVSSGAATVHFVYFSAQMTCSFVADLPIQIIRVNGSFKRNNELALIDSVHCLGVQDVFTNTTPNSLSIWSYFWDFGNGSTSSQENPTYIYPTAGIYTIVMTLTESVAGCPGYASKVMTINPIPGVQILAKDTCAGITFTMGAITPSNIVSYSWTPTNAVNSTSTATTSASASVSTVYSLSVKDVNGCIGYTYTNVFIQPPPTNIQWDTTVIVGQITPMSGYAGSNMNYTWTPTTNLSCEFCPNPVSTSTNDITYSVTVKDNMGCFTTVNTFTIKVDPRSTVDVPTAFTPNGDGTNDIIYVDGWGIKKLNYFRIYNRWGQLLFESNDIKTGWNGIFNGVPQNMETYVYQVSVETYTDKEPLLKTGSFKLIR